MKKLIIIPLLLIALAGFGQRPVVGTPVSYAQVSTGTINNVSLKKVL